MIFPLDAFFVSVAYLFVSLFVVTGFPLSAWGGSRGPVKFDRPVKSLFKAAPV